VGHFYYRPEIDGLRAIAVIPVILFHAGFSWFSGGYVGVDIFFVISGYLITSIILAEKQAGTFTILGFYERRARRILPALFFVMLACLIPAWILMPPALLKDFSQTLTAVPLFASNILFWRLASLYFDPSAEEKPLLHTWSLGVEEQYYLFFPLFIILCWSLGRRRIAGIATAVGFASFILSEYGWRHEPLANFFLASTRAWELMIGALIALASFDLPLHTRVKHEQSEFLAVLGVVLIAGSVAFYGDATPFPSVYALAPTIGTALIIGYASKQTWVGSALSAKWIVSLGLISYSAYLWHQPLFAFTRLYSLNRPSLLIMGALSVVAVTLAWLTWRYVEKPFRDRKRYSRTQIFAAALTASVVMIGIGLTGYFGNGFATRFDRAELAAINPPRSSTYRCAVPIADDPPMSKCDIGLPEPPVSVVLFGDSHADAIAGALSEGLANAGLHGIILRPAPGCGPIFGLYGSDELSQDAVDKCERSRRQITQYIADSPEIKDVIIAVRWTFHAYPIKGEINDLAYDNGEGGAYNGTRYQETFALNAKGEFVQDASSKRAAIVGFLKGFASTGKRLIIQYPVPEVGWNVPEYNLKIIVRGHEPGTISTSYAQFKRRNAFVVAALDGAGPELIRVRPADVFCDTSMRDRCIAETDGVPLYFDDNHLSSYGANFVAERILGEL
jgi:peptidoglycan/LPS O-acetylase OafA/YrhL